jgi:hypothetical protein
MERISEEIEHKSLLAQKGHLNVTFTGYSVVPMGVPPIPLDTISSPRTIAVIGLSLEIG